MAEPTEGSEGAEGQAGAEGAEGGTATRKKRSHVYPPPGHLTRKLHISLLPDRDDPGLLRCSMPLPPEVFVDGRFRLAVVGIMVDMAAGTMGVRAVHPDWTATFDLASHRIGEAEPGTTAIGECRLVRAGKNTVISETLVHAGETPIVYAETTFSRLPRRDDNPPAMPLDTPRILGDGEEPLSGPIGEVVGFEAQGAGSIGFELSPLIRNSFGSIQGGVTGVAMEQAALTLAGPGATVDFMHVYYLSAAKIGPYRATAVPLRTQPHGIAGRVDLRDTGNDRVLAQGTFLTGR